MSDEATAEGSCLVTRRFVWGTIGNDRTEKEKDLYPGERSSLLSLRGRRQKEEETLVA